MLPGRHYGTKEFHRNSRRVRANPQEWRGSTVAKGHHRTVSDEGNDFDNDVCVPEKIQSIANYLAGSFLNFLRHILPQNFIS